MRHMLSVICLMLRNTSDGDLESVPTEHTRRTFWFFLLIPQRWPTYDDLEVDGSRGGGTCTLCSQRGCGLCSVGPQYLKVPGTPQVLNKCLLQ